MVEVGVVEVESRASKFLSLQGRANVNVNGVGANGVNVNGNGVNGSGVRALSTVMPFKLADIGEGIAEVELMKWFVKVS
ncbi:hypothetical protein B484DRAFT_424609 [Ochromonadaceae sp. CCMP2298]|nr:hypothetical protein B484DRAFT_424609 [Ochromonadaceae sp. CCMP2298]